MRALSSTKSTAPPECQSLGVLGGMGPLAGAAFAYRLAQLTPAGCDQEHVPLLLRNDPRIPDRSSACMNGGRDPLPAMQEGMRFLARSGADCIVIPCNTAHLWFETLQASVSVPILHIVESVIKDLRRQGVHEGKVGVLGTPGTLKMGLYQRYLRCAGYEPVIPTPEEIEKYCVVSILAVKANRMGDALGPVSEGIVSLQRRRAKAVVLACTELPIAIPHASRSEYKVVLSDSIDALAFAVLERFGLAASPKNVPVRSSLPLCRKRKLPL